MSLYPSLEDLKVDKVIQAQTAFSANPANPAVLLEASAPISQDGNLYPKLYPELSQYMGLSLNEEEVCAMVPGAPVQGILEFFRMLLLRENLEVQPASCEQQRMLLGLPASVLLSLWLY